MSAEDLLEVARHVVALLRDRELTRAQEVLRDQQRMAARVEHSSRLSSIEGINQALAKMRAHRASLRSAVNVLPEPERTFAVREVETLLEAMFTEEEVTLRAQKRQLAKPR